MWWAICISLRNAKSSIRILIIMVKKYIFKRRKCIHESGEIIRKQQHYYTLPSCCNLIQLSHLPHLSLSLDIKRSSVERFLLTTFSVSPSLPAWPSVAHIRVIDVITSCRSWWQPPTALRKKGGEGGYCLHD